MGCRRTAKLSKFLTKHRKTLLFFKTTAKFIPLLLRLSVNPGVLGLAYLERVMAVCAFLLWLSVLSHPVQWCVRSDRTTANGTATTSSTYSYNISIGADYIISAFWLDGIC